MWFVVVDNMRIELQKKRQESKIMVDGEKKRGEYMYS
jgi:hypothetical protein